jgi:hypothetical protein
VLESRFAFLLQETSKMDNHKPFPIETDWVETPKLRHRVVHSPERKAVSVPNTPLLQNNNHFDILSPTPSSSSSVHHKKKKKRKRTPQPRINPLAQSLLCNEIPNDWDDHLVPSNEMDAVLLKEPLFSPQQSETTPERQLDQGSKSEIALDQQQQQPLQKAEPVPEQPKQPEEVLRQISFLDYLRDELTVADFDSAQELKRERVTNFLGVPGAIEKVKTFNIHSWIDHS